jgi:hypothetical protein
MNLKVINATLAGFIDSEKYKEKFNYHYSLSSIYKFIQFTKLPTDIAFEIYEFMNPVNCIDLEQMTKIIFQINFLKQTKILEDKFPLQIYEQKFEDPVFTERFFNLVKSMIKDKEIKINYINFKFTIDDNLYCLNMTLKSNKKIRECFSKRFIIKECYQWRARKCRCRRPHNKRLCKFLH